MRVMLVIHALFVMKVTMVTHCFLLVTANHVIAMVMQIRYWKCVMLLLVCVTVSTLMWGMNVNYALMIIMEMLNNKIVAVSVLNNL